MRNYVKELEFILQKKKISNALFRFFGGLFFIAYSVLIISADQKYYGIFSEFVLPPLFFLSMIYAMSGCTLNEKEDALQN